MARIVLGMASSHAPQLDMPPEKWRAYGDRSRTQPEHWYRGKTYSFPELAELRADQHLENECTDEKVQIRYSACQKAIAHLSETLARLGPDVCILLGDDQQESFHDDIMPSIAIYHGATVDDAPPGRSAWAAGFRDPVLGNAPKERVTHPTDAALGHYLIETLIDNEFDVARSTRLPAGRDNGVIGHAFHFVYRRLMNNEVIPNVPVMVNTFYPPNVPSARRSYKFGQALRQAVAAWGSDERVVIIASGGLSHTVIEEDLDLQIIERLKHNDVKKLTDYPDVRFRGGTSEIKNWIILAGVMAETGLHMNLVDYVPCYRTEAGNGCGMGFAEWV